MPDVGEAPAGSRRRRRSASAPEETATFLREETERWRKVIVDAGIKLD